MKSPSLTRVALYSLAVLIIIAVLFYRYSPRCTAGDCVNGTGVRQQTGVFHYAGEFRNGRAHGRGVFESIATGHQYDGEWQGGLMHGQGRYRYPDGTEYEGEWRDNLRHGRGELRNRADGRVIYAGEWIAGERAP
ncbi:MAG: hypothetical protein NXI24_14025 [bacterium]|nr:hypothetical protein [bacterium]